MSSLDERANVLVNARRVKYERKESKYYLLKVMGVLFVAILLILAITAISISYSLEMAVMNSCALYSDDAMCIENDYIGAVWYKPKNNAFFASYFCSDAIYFRTWSPASTSVKVHVFLEMEKENIYSLQMAGNGYWMTKKCMDFQNIRYYYEYIKQDSTVLLPDLNSPQLYTVNSSINGEVDHYETVLSDYHYQFIYGDHVTLNPEVRNSFYMFDLQSYMGVNNETGYHVAFYESEYFNTIGVTGMIIGNAEMRVCDEPNCWTNPSFHPGAFDTKYGSLASLKESIDSIHRRGVAVLLEVRWDFFTSLTPIGNYQKFNEEKTTAESRLATFVQPAPPSNGNGNRTETGTGTKTCGMDDDCDDDCGGYYILYPPSQSTDSSSNSSSSVQYNDDDDDDDDRFGTPKDISSSGYMNGDNRHNNNKGGGGDGGGDGDDGSSTSNRYCTHHIGNITTSTNRPSYTLNLRPGSPARSLLRQLFYHLYHDYHIDGLYWSETECRIGIGSEGCVNGEFTEMEKKWMEEVMEDAREVGLVQVSALPELSKSDFIIDYSLYHYFTATYAYTNTTVDIDSLVEFMQLLPDRHVWAMEGPYTASNRIINQLQPDQYTIFKTMMTLFSRNSFMFMGSDFDYPVNYEYPYAPVDYYNLIGLYYNNDNPGWTGGRHYTEILNTLQQARQYMLSSHFYDKVKDLPQTSNSDPLAGALVYAFCEDNLFGLLRSRGNEKLLMLFNNQRESKDVQFAIPYSFYYNESLAEYVLPIRFKVVYDEIRSFSPKLLGIGCDGVTQIDTRWFSEPDPSIPLMPPLGPTVGITVADHLCYYVSLKQMEYTFFIPTEIKKVKPEELELI